MKEKALGQEGFEKSKRQQDLRGIRVKAKGEAVEGIASFMKGIKQNKREQVRQEEREGS